MGRPKKSIDGEQVEALASIGCTVDEICAVLDCGKRTLESRFRDAIDRGRQKSKTSVRRALFKQMRDGSTGAAIFLAKNLLGMKNNPDWLPDGAALNSADKWTVVQPTLRAMDATVLGASFEFDSPTPNWTRLRPHPVQQRLWLSPTRFKAVTAGRGSGKTDLAKRKLVMSLAIRKPWPDPRYFFAAPTTDQAKRIAWVDFHNLIPKDWARPQDWNESELYVTTIFGSRLHLYGLDKPQRIEGLQYDGAVIDESSDVKPNVFDRSIVPALVHRSGWAWRQGVPKRTGVGATEYRQFFEAARDGRVPDAEALTWESADIVTAEQLAWAQQNLDPKDFREQFKGKWETTGGGIFYAFDRVENVRACAYVPTMPLIVSSDFNVNPMAWVLGHAYPDRMEWIDEIFVRDTNTQQTLDTLWARYSSHSGGFHFHGDASARQRHTAASFSDLAAIANDERFKRAGRTMHYRNDNPARADRFSACNAMFQNAAGRRRMFVAPNCKNLLRDLESRYYADGSREPADPKGTDMGHITDAMGYAVYDLFPIRIENDSRPTITIVHDRSVR